MAAVTAGVAAAGALASAYGAQQNAKSASNAMNSQERMVQNDLAFRQQQYNRYMGLMGPIEEQLAREAQSSQPLDYDRNAAAIKQNYGQAQRNINSAMGMRGMAGSGLDVGAMRGAAFQQAGDLSGAYSQGLQNRRNLGLSLTGRGQIQQSAQGVGQGMQGLTNLYGNQANLFNGAAAQGWQNFGQGLNGLGQMYGQYQWNKQQPNNPQAIPQTFNIPNPSMSDQQWTQNTENPFMSWE